MATTGTSSPMREVRPFICPITGSITYLHQITEAAKTDRVRMCMKDVHTLPVIFVPGIMGSNLMSNESGDVVWRLDGKLSIWASNGRSGAAARQISLHPKRTIVDMRGDVPQTPIGSISTAAQFTARGWGEVGAMSYQEFLTWLEAHLHGSSSARSSLNETLQAVKDGTPWKPQKDFAALNADECKSAERWLHPVYACGYNWLADSSISAKSLRDRILSIIKENNKGRSQCEKVIVVTHSMGGLVARACCQLPVSDGSPKIMESLIAGVVHGVMPSIGAAAAYTRCKVGTQDDSPSGLRAGTVADWGANRVIGLTGKEVTVVFAQSPGPLQLLPNKQYPHDWLQVLDSDGGRMPDPPDTSDPSNIYTERKKWWGLINEDWLKPHGGKPIDFKMQYLPNIDKAVKFHDLIQDYYHPNTWGFYGQGNGSYERAIWTLVRGDAPLDANAPSKNSIMSMDHQQVREQGTNPIGVPAADDLNVGLDELPRERDYYRFQLPVANTKVTGTGDGTVSTVSGRHPVGSSNVKQFFCITGIAHDGCYRDSMDARHATVYAINKIAAQQPLIALKA